MQYRPAIFVWLTFLFSEKWTDIYSHAYNLFLDIRLLGLPRFKKGKIRRLHNISFFEVCDLKLCNNDLSKPVRVASRDMYYRISEAILRTSIVGMVQKD